MCPLIHPCITLTKIDQPINMVKSSSRPRRTDTGTSRSISRARAPHFFKIISSSAAKHSKLMIPRKFVSKYGKNLPNLVHLKVPSGAVWQVELVKCNGDILLCNGWKEFTEYYHVKFGHFLVFRYDGNSYFHVLIFDTSASEIEYPYSSSIHGGQTSMDEADKSVEILEDFPSYQTRKEIYERDENESNVSIEIMDVPLPNFPSREAVRTNLKCEMENTSSMQEFLPEDNGSKHPNLSDVKPHCLTREIKKNCTGGTSTAPRHLKPKQSVTATGKFGALTRARAFKSDNPFLVVSMQPSFVSKKYSLPIQANFAKKHLRERQNKVTLRVSDGRTWSVRCYRTKISGQGFLGWISFARDNNLKVGDVCVFEMIKEEGFEPLFNVTIFRE